METVMPALEHRATVIFLHGRDSTASEFSAEFFESQITDGRTLTEALPQVKWVFPTAETLKAARYDGVEMSQWFDMWTTEAPHERPEIQERGLQSASKSIKRIIEAEAVIIGTENVIVGGLSQGAAVAIRALVDGKMRIGGFIGLCAWMPFIGNTDTTGPRMSMPALICHSVDDEVIASKFGAHLRDSLINLGFHVTWRCYEDGGHWVNEPAGVDDFVTFLGNIFKWTTKT